jgi:hypothetical protein
LVTDTNEDPPIAYNSQADPKVFCWKVSEYANGSGEIGRLLDHFGLDLRPLTRLSGEEFTLDQWMSPYTKITGDWDDWSEARKLEAWHEHRAEIEASYQSPDDLITALDPFVQALESDRSVYKTLGIDDPYFTNGSFLLHLKDLRSMADWAQSQGFRKIRLLVA